MGQIQSYLCQAYKSLNLPGGEEGQPQQSPHFLIRATSKSLTFQKYFFLSVQYLRIRIFFENMSTLGNT